MDRAHAVPAVAGDGEHRDVTQKPGDVVDQDSVTAKQDGRPEYRIAEARLRKGLLDQRLAAEVVIR